ncbi:hypothetical protein [Elizabethkingia anophelis]|uniref:hypothetical protein n=1 Tax=Elizabethkingia anophelis TaxID=1117645 RepID=UPI0020113C63|nr:hypothetical protein [Elizabethkingia anophelis]EJC8061037.1 hypothetical protein [Elizabethkingia anophelis]MCL1640982.1 hypothetical protein [Elizabethkingia anophelis]MCL1646783.1 hypothetical protein [Elizabethkingia anophelis]MDV3779779.1 hypothetical protein [Elizabethkingia anophelis]MDV3789655.1 hypothetical protein [Elizabethkingia anophelis]
MSKNNNKSSTNTINWETMLIIGVVAFIIYVFNKSKWDLDNLFKNITSLEWWKGLLKGNVTTHPTEGGSSDGTETSGVPDEKKKPTVDVGNVEIIDKDVDNTFTYHAKYFTDREYFGATLTPSRFRSNYSFLMLQLDRIRENWGSPIKITKGYQNPTVTDIAYYNGYNLCLAVNIAPVIGSVSQLSTVITSLVNKGIIGRCTLSVVNGSVYLWFNNKK